MRQAARSKLTVPVAAQSQGWLNFRSLEFCLVVLTTCSSKQKTCIAFEGFTCRVFVKDITRPLHINRQRSLTFLFFSSTFRSSTVTIIVLALKLIEMYTLLNIKPFLSLVSTFSRIRHGQLVTLYK